MKTHHRTSVQSSALISSALLLAAAAQAQPDYGPAIWNPPGCTKWYTSGYGHHFCVIHDMEGYYLASISYLNTCGVSASVYYGVNGKQDTSTDAGAGQITQMCREANYAWHVSCWNQWMFGTEHEGFASNPAWYTSAMYSATSGLQYHLTQAGGIPIDRNHIIGHNEWQNGNWKNWMAANYGSINTSCNTHTDPGGYFDWSNLMSQISSHAVNPHINPVVAQNSDGRLELFAVGHTGNLYHNYQTAPNAGWSGWISLGGTWAQNTVPAVGKNSDGRLEVFIIGTDGQMNHAWEGTAGSSTSWSGWAQLGGSWTQTAKVQTGMNADGAMEIFVIGGDGQLNHKYQTGGGNWSAWLQFGGNWDQNADIAAGSNLDGRQELFLIGNTGNLYHIYQTSPNGSWSGFNSLGGTWPQTARIGLGRNSDGRLEVFIVGSTSQLYHLWQTAANGGWTSSWGTLNGSWEWDAKPVVASDQNGYLEVFLIGNTGNFYHIYESSSGWSGWASLGGTFTQNIRPCVGRNADGRLEAFMTGQGSDMVHAYQTSANGTTWSGWSSLGGGWN